ncbi:MAG: hypothetical protein JWO19_1946 [Bryobacterales bacterium]|nr:hypothetical protein [Bryobacterales bacterium]
MTSIIVVPVPDSVVDRTDVEPLLAALGAGRDVKSTYILGVDEPRVLTEILRSGTALVIFNVADSTLMEVAAGVAARWLR